ncbi:MAG: hypothetical protein KDD62_08235, partial [Bdellovibrionales bacterium]|nr:hypothetical protein [Bdellovibrionales bacterium]
CGKYVESLEDGQSIEEACKDDCPFDPGKTEAGVCGCGVQDVLKIDGTYDCSLDLCINDPDKTAPGVCGCGKLDKDTDGDGVLDCQDKCPNTASKIAPDECGCNERIFYKKDGSRECRSFTSIPTKSKAGKSLLNLSTGEKFVPEVPAFEVPDSCGRSCKIKVNFEKYIFSSHGNNVGAAAAKSKRKQSPDLKAKYEVTLNEIGSRGTKTSKRYTKKQKLSIGKLKPGQNYIISYKLHAVKKDKSSNERVVATSASSKSISFRMPGGS